MPILTDFLTDIAEAIRDKKGTTAKINAQNFASEIESIETGGNSDPKLQEKTITENGTYTPDTAYDGISKVTVNVQPDLQEKTITENGTYTPNTAYDGFSKVNVNVPIPSGYVKPSGNLDIVVNGTYDVTNKASVNVNIPVTECDRNHIIEVDTLPTENIVENALYKVGDSYYKYANEFKDVIAFLGSDQPISIVDYITQGGCAFTLYYVDNYENVVNPTPTSSDDNFTLYYDVSRNDIYFFYTSDELSEWVPFRTDFGMANGGAITDISQATQDGTMYALVDNGWKRAEWTRI